jgi:hypothetical protein
MHIIGYAIRVSMTLETNSIGKSLNRTKNEVGD